MAQPVKCLDKHGDHEFRFSVPHETLWAEGRSSSSTIESIGYSSRGPRLDSQLLHSDSNP